MQIVITGGAGFLGTQLTKALLASKDAGATPIPFDSILSIDLTVSRVDDERVISATGDITDPDFVLPLIGQDTLAIYHLAAVLSGGSAQNFDAAMAVNIDATRLLLEAARTQSSSPHFIFTSSLAVFGGQLPETLPATYGTQPDSTYGATKAIGELLINEYSRKGYIRGLTCRLPTISIRPGVPNSAASSFASGIIREPLAGLPAPCPVPHETRMWLSSPDTIVTNLVHVLSLPAEALPSWRVLNMPGICVTVGDMLSALEEVAGQEARNLVTDEPNPAIMEIVCSWPGKFDVSRELALGFTADTSFSEMIKQYQQYQGDAKER